MDLDGRKVAKEYRNRLSQEIEELKGKGVTPTIAPILVGDDPGANVYYRTKEKSAQRWGIRFEGVKMDKDSSKQQVLEKLDELNNNPEIHGLFLELPLPEGLDIGELSSKIALEKDIDCINPANMGRLLAGGALSQSYRNLKERPDVLLPATPYGVMELLKAYDIELAGKEIVIVGGGAIGLPLSMLMLREGYSTVTVCEYQGKDLPAQTRRADVLCVAVGKKDFITEDMVKEGAVVVDIGVNQTEGGITGDVDYEKVKEKASYITPVPGGVGSMTTTMIMANTVKAAKFITSREGF